MGERHIVNGCSSAWTLGRLWLPVKLSKLSETILNKLAHFPVVCREASFCVNYQQCIDRLVGAGSIKVNGNCSFCRPLVINAAYHTGIVSIH